MSISNRLPPILRAGLIAGVFSALATDISMVVLFAASGTPLDLFLRLIGSAVLIAFGIDGAAVLPVALAADYGMGIIAGIGFTAAVTRIPRLRLCSWPQAIIIGLVFGEVLGSALYWIMVALLRLPAEVALPLFGTASFFHLVWGVALGLSARWLTRAESYN